MPDACMPLKIEKLAKLEILVTVTGITGIPVPAQSAGVRTVLWGQQVLRLRSDDVYTTLYVMCVPMYSLHRYIVTSLREYFQSIPAPDNASLNWTG